MAIWGNIESFISWFIYDTGFGGLVVGLLLYWLLLHKTVMKLVKKRKEKRKQSEQLTEAAAVETKTE